MATSIAVFNPGQLPAFARKGEISAIAKALMGGSAQTGKRISIRGGVFRLVVDGKEVVAMDERYLDVVIVNAAPKVSRTFYAAAFDENNPAAPDCWSKNGDVPDSDVRAPQGPNCAQCPQNVKGSGTGETRACRYNQRLAVVLANDQEGDVMQLTLAATSIFGKAEGENRPLQEHARWLGAQGVDPTMLVTRLKFDTKAATPKLFFKPMRWLTDDEFANCQEQGLTPEALKAVELTVSQADGVTGVAAPAPFAGTPPKAKKAAPAVVVEEEEEEEEAPAPVVVKKKKAAAPVVVVEEEEEEEEAPAPAPVVKKKKVAAPVVVADDEEEEEAPAPEPTVRAPAAKAKAAAPAATGLASTLAAWDDED